MPTDADVDVDADEDGRVFGRSGVDASDCDCECPCPCPCPGLFAARTDMAVEVGEIGANFMLLLRPLNGSGESEFGDRNDASEPEPDPLE